MLWRATLRELVERGVAFRWHERRQLEHTAILAHWLLAAWVEQAPTPAQLMGDYDPAESEQALDRLTGDDQRAQNLRNLERAYEQQAARKAARKAAP